MGSVPGVPNTNVPQISFTPQGVSLPSATDVLAGVQEDINYAFGGNVNPALSTPQGQLATSETAIIVDKDSQIAYVCTQIDPQYATGRFQDAIGRLYFMTRIAALATVVQCVLTGPVNSPVAAGTLAQDTAGNTYVLLASVTIGSGGTVLSSWANILTGPIPCPANTLTLVYQSAGFDAINNPSAGEIGNDVETPAAFEFRRQNSVALNGRGTCPSIQANVFAVPGVLDCYVIDNPSGNTVNSNPLPGGIPNPTNYSLVPHSLYVAVVGGTAAAITQAIWNKKDGGCNYNGNTSATVTDPNYDYPQPTYTVTYEIPTSTPVYFAVTIQNNSSLPSNIVALVQAAIIAQFSGTNGSARARIGALILAASYYGVVAATASNVLLVSVAVGLSASPTGTSIQMGIDQSPTIDASNITVTLE